MHNKQKDVAIIDLGVGNLFSIERACQAVGLKAMITADTARIELADAVILPGVGAFANAMATLQQIDLIPVLNCLYENDRPILGICLGMQLLMEYSEEFGQHQGLGFINGTVKGLKREVDDDIPHIGWSPIFGDSNTDRWDKTLLNCFRNQTYQYFVHSYYVSPEQQNDILAYTCYSDFSFCAVIQKENITGCQFHPERSGNAGLGIYKQWALQYGLLS